MRCRILYGVNAAETQARVTGEPVSGATQPVSDTGLPLSCSGVARVIMTALRISLLLPVFLHLGILPGTGACAGGCSHFRVLEIPQGGIMGYMQEDQGMANGYAENRDQLLRRVNRLEGQVRGVGRMIGEDRYCLEIVTQLSAVQAAAREISLQLLAGHVSHCVADAIRSGDAEPKIEELIETLGRAMGR